MIDHRLCLVLVALATVAIAAAPSARNEISLAGNALDVELSRGQITSRCDYYNETNCALSPNHAKCNGTDICKRHGDSDKPGLCYVLWKKNPDGSLAVKLKGCWIGSTDGCHEEARCVEKKKDPKKNLMFCCCSGDFCNQEMHHDPQEEQGQTPESLPSGTDTAEGSQSYSPYVVLLSSILFIALAVFAVTSIVMFYRKRKDSCSSEYGSGDDHMHISESSMPFLGLNIQLIEVKAQGRFGHVWRGRAPCRDGIDQDVAVKIFPYQDRISWAQEQEIYELPQLRHENILHFIGVERKLDGYSIGARSSEYWLITEYHQLGSLCDYLKSKVVTYPELLKISEGIARGLTHLHEEIAPTKVDGLKPTVAHRDFKSKNVLLKSDLTPCIADFGLGLIFRPNEPAKEALGQVGTRRYMAPEVLEGAISFNRDAFLRIDMYACGLVLWELVSRCSAQDGPVGTYQLPFEEEAGPHPSLEEIQDVVCQQKKRPELKESWRRHHGLRTICDTIEECWDQDAEARLSASCVEERIRPLKASANLINFNNPLGPNVIGGVRLVASEIASRNALNAPLLVNETRT